MVRSDIHPSFGKEDIESMDVMQYEYGFDLQDLQSIIDEFHNLYDEAKNASEEPPDFCSYYEFLDTKDGKEKLIDSLEFGFEEFSNG